jgi:hypothetical protein
VRAKELAAVLFAAAFWDLQQRRYFKLTAGRRRRLLIPRSRILVARTRPGERPGLEGDLLTAPTVEDTSGLPGDVGDVRGLVGAWFGKPVEDPVWEGAAAVIRERASLGVLHRRQGADREPEAFTTDCQPVGQAEAFTALHSGWSRFCREEPYLHRLLVRECSRASRRHGASRARLR